MTQPYAHPHDHSHVHPAPAPAWSLLRLSAIQRALIVTVLLTLLWFAVFAVIN